MYIYIGPWKLILVVHNFPNSTVAYQFEWALQHPEKTRTLKGVFIIFSSMHISIGFIT